MRVGSLWCGNDMFSASKQNSLLKKFLKELSIFLSKTSDYKLGYTIGELVKFKRPFPSLKSGGVKIHIYSMSANSLCFFNRRCECGSDAAF